MTSPRFVWRSWRKENFKLLGRREFQLSSQFRDIATVVIEKTINPEIQQPCAISMIERLMHDIHFAIVPHNSSKKQKRKYYACKITPMRLRRPQHVHFCTDHALEVVHVLQKHYPIKRYPMRSRLIVPEKSLSYLMEKLSDWNAVIVSKDESGNQPSVVCEMNPGLFRDCDAFPRTLQGRLEILAVSVHVDAHVDQYDGAENFPSRSTNESDSVVQLGQRVQNHNISTENRSDEDQVKQYRCSTCDAVVGDGRQCRKHFKSEWHKHNLKRKTKELPPLSAEGCMTDMEMGDLKPDMKEYSF